MGRISICSQAEAEAEVGLRFVHAANQCVVDTLGGVLTAV